MPVTPMCGISGRVNYRTGAPVAAETLAAMCDLLQHRGPDGAGVWSDGAVGFGHRRLAVIDPSDAGRQPFRSADGRLTITFNGEIYNFQEVRRDLEQHGCRFVSRTDTEVILQAYRHYGVECLDRLRGMFAFAIWDAGEQRLFAARDRAGQKPFYYREDADGLAFASEPKAFLAERSFVPEADPDALFHYLSFQYVPSPGSAFKGLRRLPPAHFLTVDRGRVSIARYWSLRYSPKPNTSEADATTQMRADLAEATRIMLVSDVPVGAFLSGGIDSSLVVAMMAQAGAGRVKTFSIGFDETEYNELEYARRVADRFGTDHHEAIVRPDALAILPKLVWHYNEPFADSSAIPTLYLAEMTRRHVTVALNGDAGDENFAGYNRYVASRLAARLDRIPQPARQALTRWAGRIPNGRTRSTRSRIQRFLHAAADSRERRYARWMFHFDDTQKREICSPAFLARVTSRESESQYEALFAAAHGEDLLDATLGADVGSYLPDDLLVKVDIATMAYGLEARSPLLDHVVMERAARLPVDFKLRGSEKKYLLKRVARGLLPDDVIDRPKMGFGVPLDRWFRGPLRELAHDVLLGSRLRARGYFRVEAIERLLHEHETGRRNWHYQMWNLLVLELWHQTFIDARPAAQQPSTAGTAA
jgi:asparagine synthase (glutamine-hydrolysing)